MKCYEYVKDTRYTLSPRETQIEIGSSIKVDNLEYWDVFFEGNKKGTATNFEAAIKCLFIVTGEKERIDIENDIVEIKDRK